MLVILGCWEWKSIELARNQQEHLRGNGER